MSVNVSNAARRSHDRTGGQVYFPASQDIAGHGSGGRTSRPANCEWAALLVATGPGPLLGKNGGGATATHGVLLPRVIPSAAPGFEEPAADRGRVCHRQRYCQPGVYRGNWRWPKLQAAQVYGSGGFRCGRRSCDDPFYASSKTCSECGYGMEVLPLSVREWTCPACQTTHDRDVNAAINRKQNTVGYTGINAWGQEGSGLAGTASETGLVEPGTLPWVNTHFHSQER